MTEVEGFVKPGFERVVDMFTVVSSEDDFVGGSCSVIHEGETIVDLWAGVADPDSGRPWEADTPVIIFSATKGITAICAHRLVQDGMLELDAPISKYWPEFASAGKEEALVRWALSHRVGLPAPDASVTMDDILGWEGVVASLAAQSPEWPPGQTHGYHAHTFGWIVGELVRRAWGKSIGEYLASEIAGPLDADVWIGLPDSQLARRATLIPPKAPTDSESQALGQRINDPSSLMARVRGPIGMSSWNQDDYLQAQMPAANGVASARGLSKVYASVVGEVGGRRTLDQSTVETARAVQSDDIDAVLGRRSIYGLGFALPPFLAASCPSTAFGHPGANGTLAFADVDHKLGFGFVINGWHNILVENPNSKRNRMAGSVYASLA